MPQTPKGNRFLPFLSYSELKTMYKHENNPKSKLRLQACLMRKRGNTLENISQVVEYPLTTIGDWLRRIEKEGIERRHSKKQTGRPPFLTKDQKDEVISALSDSPQAQDLPYKIWTTKVLAYFIKQKYDVTYKIRKLEKLVHELGFNFKKARPEHKLADQKLQDTFKKTSSMKLGPILKLDGRSYFLTRASFR